MCIESLSLSLLYPPLLLLLYPAGWFLLAALLPWGFRLWVFACVKHLETLFLVKGTNKKKKTRRF